MSQAQPGLVVEEGSKVRCAWLGALVSSLAAGMQARTDEVLASVRAANEALVGANP